MVKDGITYFQAAATVESPRTAVNGLYPCPCCAAVVFDKAGGYDICERCGWEDDPVQEAQPDLRGGANRHSLIEARENVSKHGVSDPQFARAVRLP